MNFETDRQQDITNDELLLALHRPDQGVYVSELRSRELIAQDLTALREAYSASTGSIIVALDFDLCLTQIPNSERSHRLDRYVPPDCPPAKRYSTIGLPALLPHAETAATYNQLTNELWEQILLAERILGERNSRDEAIYKLYREARKLVQDTGITAEEIELLAGYLCPRDGMVEFLHTLTATGLDTYIISAGLQPFIEAFMAQYDFPHIPVHANKLVLDIYGHAIHSMHFDALQRTIPESMKDIDKESFVSPYNKHTVLSEILHGEQYPLIITLGDSISDAQVITLSRDLQISQPPLDPLHVPVGLKIGLLNNMDPNFATMDKVDNLKFQRKLEFFLQEFDLVLTDNPSLRVADLLLRRLFYEG